MAISKFDNGHYVPPVKWRHYKGRNYMIRLGASGEVVTIKVVYNNGLARARRYLNLDGPTAKAVKALL